MSTLRAEIAASLRRAALHDPARRSPPAAVLWPDPYREWESVVGQVQEAAPVLILGDRGRTVARGPAIWLRAVLACRGPVDVPPLVAISERVVRRDGTNPWVVYLPGVSRSDLLSATDRRHPLAPLVDVAHRSAWWLEGDQPWAPVAFLRSREGPHLEIATDADTRIALDEALPTLLGQDVAELRSRGRLDADRLRALLVPDPARDVLAWIDDPGATRERLGTAWNTFVARCGREYGFDPDRDTPITAAERLGRREGAWTAVWARFSEAPRRYPRIPEVLDRAGPGRSPPG